MSYDTPVPGLHPDVFISSTVLDLPAHRKAAIDATWRCGMYPLAMEKDSASAADALTYSLALVDRAQVYVGIFGVRYGTPWRADPQRRSISELEYRRALERDLPILIFLMADDHPVLARDIETNTKRRQQLAALKRELRAKHVVAFFQSPTDLGRLVFEALSALNASGQVVLRSSTSTAPTNTASVLTSGMVGQAPANIHHPQARMIPAPPNPYFAHPYTLGHAFIGRAKEQTKLDMWAQDTTPATVPLFVLEAIGGMGKSALAWHWLQTSASIVRPDLAGVLWWSFYETETTVTQCVLHALAYVSEQPLSQIEQLTPVEREQALLKALSSRPYLFVLDGIERLLVAYHRMNDVYQADDHVGQAVAVRSPLRDGQQVLARTVSQRWVDALRWCTDPRDGAFLAKLTRCAPSKVLLTTRLTPQDLRDRHTRMLLPGVHMQPLEGLAPHDALALLRHLGVHGDRERLLTFLGQVGFHALVVAVVAGLVSHYYPAPGNFDRWYTDVGTRLQLSAMDLRQRQTHILAAAVADLLPEVQTVLCRLAAFRYPVDYAALKAVNPFLLPFIAPPLPAEIDEADRRWLKRYEPAELRTTRVPGAGETGAPLAAPTAMHRARIEAWCVGLREESEELRAALPFTKRRHSQQKLSLEQERLQQELARIEGQVQALVTYAQSSLAEAEQLAGAGKEQEALAAFHQALSELEARGLLQWDRSANRYDLHPLVRAYAFEQLAQPEKVQTFQRIRDHFEALPPENVEHVTDVADLWRTLEIYHALLGAGKHDAAYDLFRERLHDPLYYTLGAYPNIVRLLEPLFVEGEERPPALRNPEAQSACMTDLSGVLRHLGEYQRALALQERHLRFNLDRKAVTAVLVGLDNYAITLIEVGWLAQGKHVVDIQEALATAADNQVQLAMAYLRRLWLTRILGDWMTSQRAFIAFSARIPTSRRAIWQAQAANFYAKSCMVCGQPDDVISQTVAEAAAYAKQGSTLDEQNLSELLAEVAMRKQQWEDAAEHWQTCITMRQRSGMPIAEPFARLASCQAWLGYTSLARQTLKQTLDETPETPPHTACAEAWLALGEREAATQHALAGYREAWAQGEPYVSRDNLQRAEQVLQQLGEPVPTLPPFNQAHQLPIPYELEIRALIAEEEMKHPHQ